MSRLKCAAELRFKCHPGCEVQNFGFWGAKYEVRINTMVFVLVVTQQDRYGLLGRRNTVSLKSISVNHRKVWLRHLLAPCLSWQWKDVALIAKSGNKFSIQRIAGVPTAERNHVPARYLKVPAVRNPLKSCFPSSARLFPFHKGKLDLAGVIGKTIEGAYCARKVTFNHSTQKEACNEKILVSSSCTRRRS